MPFPTSTFVQRDQAYQLLQSDPIGAGSYAHVYHARHHGLQRDVAVKAVHPGLDPARQEQARLLLRAEAQLHSQLTHDHIVPARTLEYDRETDEPYLVCDFCNGGSLAGVLASGPLDEQLAIRLVGGLLDGLSYMHTRQIIHQDLKPANILLQRDSHGMKALLADFGSARDLRVARASDTPAPVPMLTPEYCAPEQLGPAPVGDVCVDIFALGLILAEMVSGYAPLKPRLAGCRNPRLLNNWLYSVGHPQLSPGLWRVILRATENNPQRRFQHAAEFQRSLYALASTSRPPAQPRPGRLSWQQGLGIGLARLSAVLALAAATLVGAEHDLLADASAAVAGLHLPTLPALNRALLQRYSAIQEAVVTTSSTAGTPVAANLPALPTPTITGVATSPPALPTPTIVGVATHARLPLPATPAVAASSRPTPPQATRAVAAQPLSSRPSRPAAPGQIARQTAIPIPLPESAWPAGQEAPLAAPPAPLSDALLPW